MRPTKDFISADPGMPGAADTSSVVRMHHGYGGAIWLLAGYALLLVLATAVRLRPGSAAIGDALLVVAPLGAALATIVSARPLNRSAALAWTLLAASAATATLAAAVHMALPQGRWSDVAGVIHALGYALLLASLGLLMHGRGRAGTMGTLLDAVLVATAASILIVYWAPSARVVAQGARAFSAVETFVLHFTPVLGVCIAVLAVVLIIGRVPLARLAIGTGAALVAVGVVPVALAQAICCDASSPATFAVIGGWGLIAVGAALQHVRGDVVASPEAGLQLRQVTPPLVAAVMGVVALSAFTTPIQGKAALAIGLLGALLALRSAQLVRHAGAVSAERRELAQSRALVELSRALAGTTELDRALAVVTRWTCHLLGGKAAVIELLDDSGTTLVCRATFGLSEDLLGMKFPVAGSFSGWTVTHGRARATANAESDPLVSQASLKYVRGSTMAAAPLRYRRRTLGALTCVGRHSFDESDLELLGALADQASLAIENARLFEQVRILSFTDPLTGLANRRQLEHDIAREFAAANRGRQLVGVMFDLDRFKEYNDTHGHLAGDAALRTLGEVLARFTRRMNLAVRYGGDEFFVLLGDATPEKAEVFVQRVIDQFDEEVRKLGYGDLRASAGVAPYAPHMKTPDALIDAADRALYASKRVRAST